MFGAIPAELILEVAKRDGVYTQLAFRFPPMVNIREEFLTSVAVELDVPANEHGSNFKSIGHEDHPSFTATRNWLEHRGFITTERRWSNGDRVIDPFYLNGKYFDVGDKFPCAAAMNIHLQYK